MKSLKTVTSNEITQMHWSLQETSWTSFFIIYTSCQVTTVWNTRWRLAYKIRSTCSPTCLLPAVHNNIPTRQLSQVIRSIFSFQASWMTWIVVDMSELSSTPRSRRELEGVMAAPLRSIGLWSIRYCRRAVANYMHSVLPAFNVFKSSQLADILQ